MAAKSDFNILTFNVNCIAKIEKFSKVIRETFSCTQTNNIVFLQECKIPKLRKEHEQVLEFHKLKSQYSPALRGLGGLLFICREDQKAKLVHQDENHQIIEVNKTKVKSLIFTVEQKI